LESPERPKAAALPGGIFSWMPVTAEGSLQDDTESYAEEAYEVQGFFLGQMVILSW